MKKSLYITGLLYLFLYMFPFPFMFSFTNVLDPIVYFIGRKVFNINMFRQEHIYALDTTYEYVKVVTLFLISIILGTLVQVLFSKRVKFDLIYNSTVLYARYFVGLLIIEYGITKVCGAQFNTPGYIKLESTFGESSPMGLLWTFMEASRPYTIFVGLLQVFSGTLILFKRTTILGSLLTFIVMFNILMMNLCYDVPAKIFSIHLLLLSGLIAAPEIKTVYSFFILRVPVQLPPIQKAESKYRLAQPILKGLFIGGYVVFCIQHFIHFPLTKNLGAELSEMDGVYKTDLFVIENDTLPSLTSDSVRWKSLIISKGISAVTKMTDSAEKYNVTIDSISKTIMFVSKSSSDENYKLKYSQESDKFRFEGLWKGKKMLALFSKKNYNDYPLINRGFHWITDTLYNR